VIGIMLRGVRWRVIAGYPKADQHSFARATNMGLLGNMLFPARAGEVIRVLTLVKLLGSTLSRPLASAFIDRLVDFFVLFSSASVLYWYLPISELLGKWLTVFFVVGATLTGSIILYVRSSGVGGALISKFFSRLLKRWPIRPEVFFEEFRAEFGRLMSSWLSVELVFIAALILFVDYCAILAMFHAFNLSLAIEAPLLFWVFMAAGSALPSTPGYVGIYQIAAVWSLSLYSVSASTSVAVATTLQLVTLLVALGMVGAKVTTLHRMT